jgi:hypothetical protein
MAVILEVSCGRYSVPRKTTEITDDEHRYHEHRINRRAANCGPLGLYALCGFMTGPRTEPER